MPAHVDAKPGRRGPVGRCCGESGLASWFDAAMSVHLFTLSDMRLANGAEAPFPLDLDHPEEANGPSGARFEAGYGWPSIGSMHEELGRGGLPRDLAQTDWERSA